MFLSKDDLKLGYGIDLDIAAYYVDRKVPENNLYWKGRHLYVNTMPGFIFMPVYTDLLRRCGVSKEVLLDGRFIQLAEAVMHSAALQEVEGRSMLSHYEECLALAGKNSVNPMFLAALDDYFHGRPVPHGLHIGTPFRSLNRADAYLCALCVIPFGVEDAHRFLEAWNALITIYLITDDLEDIRQDLKDHEDNVAIEAGLNEAGAKIIEGMVDNAMASMQKLNPVLANRFEHKLHYTDIRGIIRSFAQES
jgi:hypothetical protein